MNIINYVIILWFLMMQFGRTEYTEEDYVKVAKDYIYEKYNNTVDCNYKVVVDNKVYIYIDQKGYDDIPYNYLDSLILLDKETKKIIHAKLKMNPEVDERYNDGNPLPLIKIPDFINKSIYNGKYNINESDVKVSQKGKHKNYYEIDNAPFILKEKIKNMIDVKKMFEPITNNNKGNVYELAYFIDFIDENYDNYSMILFAFTKKLKKVTKNGRRLKL